MSWERVAMTVLANLISSQRGFVLCCVICAAGITAVLICLAFV